MEKWHYLPVKKLSRRVTGVTSRGVTSNNYGDLYCLNYLHSFRAKKKLQSHKRVGQNKDFCNVVMSFEDTKILEFNQYKKSDKAPFIY